MIQNSQQIKLMKKIGRYSTSRKNSKQQQSKLPRFISFSKQIQNILKFPKLKSNIVKDKQRIFTQNYQLLGNPQNPYIINKIKQYTTNPSNVKLHKFYTQQSTKKLLKSSFLITSNQQNNSIQCSHKNKKKCTKTQFLIPKAYLMNQLQKIQRLIQKRQQQKHIYQCLSQRIKYQISPKKIKVKILDNPIPINKFTWYQKWQLAQKNYQTTKKNILAQKIKKFSCKNNNVRILAIGQRSCP